MKSNLLISVNHIGRIPPLYQDGPVVNPIRVDIKTAHAIVCSLFPAYEHNPANPSEKVKLTLQNLFEDNFPKEVNNNTNLYYKIKTSRSSKTILVYDTSTYKLYYIGCYFKT